MPVGLTEDLGFQVELENWLFSSTSWWEGVGAQGLEMRWGCEASLHVSDFEAWTGHYTMVGSLNQLPGIVGGMGNVEWKQNSISWIHKGCMSYLKWEVRVLGAGELSIGLKTWSRIECWHTQSHVQLTWVLECWLYLNSASIVNVWAFVCLVLGYVLLGTRRFIHIREAIDLGTAC